LPSFLNIINGGENQDDQVAESESQVLYSIVNRQGTVKLQVKIRIANRRFTAFLINIGQTTSMVALFSPTFFDSSKTWHNECF
jgi:hypothetical protein